MAVAVLAAGVGQQLASMHQRTRQVGWMPGCVPQSGRGRARSCFLSQRAAEGHEEDSQGAKGGAVSAQQHRERKVDLRSAL